MLTGYTVVDDTYWHQFLDAEGQVQSDIRQGFPYRLAATSESANAAAPPIAVDSDMNLPDGRRLPTDDLVQYSASQAALRKNEWILCGTDARYYRRFRRPGG